MGNGQQQQVSATAIPTPWLALLVTILLGIGTIVGAQLAGVRADLKALRADVREIDIRSVTNAAILSSHIDTPGHPGVTNDLRELEREMNE